jgi:hypothetical protein
MVRRIETGTVFPEKVTHFRKQRHKWNKNVLIVKVLPPLIDPIHSQGEALFPQNPQHEHGVPQDISLPETRRFHQKSKNPLAPQIQDPSRCPTDPTTDIVKEGTHTDADRDTELIQM